MTEPGWSQLGLPLGWQESSVCTIIHCFSGGNQKGASNCNSNQHSNVRCRCPKLIPLQDDLPAFLRFPQIKEMLSLSEWDTCMKICKAEAIRYQTEARCLAHCWWPAEGSEGWGRLSLQCRHMGLGRWAFIRPRFIAPVCQEAISTVAVLQVWLVLFLKLRIFPSVHNRWRNCAALPPSSCSNFQYQLPLISCSLRRNEWKILPIKPKFTF